jgi:hypothetical protein
MTEISAGSGVCEEARGAGSTAAVGPADAGRRAGVRVARGISSMVAGDEALSVGFYFEWRCMPIVAGGWQASNYCITNRLQRFAI